MSYQHPQQKALSSFTQNIDFIRGYSNNSPIVTKFFFSYLQGHTISVARTKSGAVMAPLVSTYWWHRIWSSLVGSSISRFRFSYPEGILRDSRLQSSVMPANLGLGIFILSTIYFYRYRFLASKLMRKFQSGRPAIFYKKLRSFLHTRYRLSGFL